MGARGGTGRQGEAVGGGGMEDESVVPFSFLRVTQGGGESELKSGRFATRLSANEQKIAGLHQSLGRVGDKAERAERLGAPRSAQDLPAPELACTSSRPSTSFSRLMGRGLFSDEPRIMRVQPRTLLVYPAHSSL
jgi:hypothetical protein